MDSISIIAAGIAGLFTLVILGRLLHRPNSVAEDDREMAMPKGPVETFVRAVNRCESKQDADYIAAVEKLRNDRSAAATIEKLYPKAPPELKLSLLLAAAELGDPTRSFLVSIASSPVSQAGGTYAAVEDSRLRLVALDGLEQMALNGSKAAMDGIEQLVQSKDRAVRIGAVAALKFGGATESIARLRQSLGPHDIHLLDVQRPDVKDVPQVSDPTRDLTRFDSGSGVRPHPERVGESDGPRGRQQRRGSPFIGRNANG